MSANLERAMKLWRYKLIYVDGRGYYRWSSKAALPKGAHAGRIAKPYSSELKRHFASVSELHQAAKGPQQISLF